MTIDYLTIPGVFMHAGDREIIKELSSRVAELFSPCNIVHIGVQWGGSLYCSRVGAPQATIYGVDFHGADELKGTDEQKAELGMIPLVGDSALVHAGFTYPIHFLYVDGDHHYEPLSLDIRNWASKVVVGGYVAFHDAAECTWAPDVNRAIADNLSANSWEDLGISGWSRYFRRLT